MWEGQSGWTAADSSGRSLSQHSMSAAQPGHGGEGDGVVVIGFDGTSSIVLRIEARYPLKLMHHINRHNSLTPNTALAAHTISTAATTDATATAAATVQTRAAASQMPRLPAYLPPVVQIVGYGGGLLSADRLTIDVRLAEKSALVLTSPANGRAYKQRQPGQQASSEMKHTLYIGPSALLLFVPSPLSLFAASSLVTSTEVHMHSDSSLLLLEVISGGRHTQGEQFGQSRYCSTTTVYFTLADDSIPIPALRDRNVLSAQQDDTATVGRYKARGTVLLLGPHLLPLAVELFMTFNRRTVRKKAAGRAHAEKLGCVVTASWVCGTAPDVLSSDCVVDSAAIERCLSGGRVSGGCLLRLLSVEVESLLQTVGGLLVALDTHMQGVAPWQRV